MKEKDGLDEILVHVGDFGKPQTIALLIICLIVFFHEGTHLGYVFMAMDSDYRCHIPACNDSTSEFESNWTNNAIPSDNMHKLSKCSMHPVIFDNNSHINNECSLLNFNKEQIIECENHVFKDDEHYIGREFGILCENKRWILSLVGTITNVGMFFGMVLSGLISDKYGRKFVFLTGTLLNGILGISKSFMPNFTSFCVLEFLEQLFNAACFGTAFVIGSELVSQKKRRWAVTTIFVSAALGDVWFGLVAWKSRNWRSIIYFTCGPCIFMLLFYRYIPESIRWLLSKGEMEKPKKILKKYARKNGKKIPESYFHILNRNIRKNEESNANISLMKMMKSPSLLLRLINCNFLMISTLMLYFGAILYSVSLAGNKYLNFMLVAFTDIPAYIIVPILSDRIGNRFALLGSYFITSISYLALIFIDEGTTWLYLLVYCLGKFGTTALVLLMYIIVSEVFPTPLRQTALGLSTTLGRLGGILSQQIPLLGFLWKPLPLVTFASVASLAGFCSLLLPDTTNIDLPDTIEEAEQIGKQPAVMI